MEEDRSKLPFRKNCEGYFTDHLRNILAKKSEQGIIMFPGGGIDEGESVEEGMKREAFEEAGVKIKDLKFLRKINIIWGKDWAKTDKQKKRFSLFQGDDMHFFSGKIEEIKENKGEEDYWGENKTMPLSEAIKIVELTKDLDESTKEYRQVQLSLLRELEKNL